MSLTKLMGPRRTNELRSRMNAQEYQQYLEKGVCENMEIHYEGCSKDWVTDFTTHAADHSKLNNNIALEFLESWSVDETNEVGRNELFKRSIANAKKAFPNRDFIIVPHETASGCFHTHVLFNTIGNDGVRLHDKGFNRKRWNKVCDETSIRHGLTPVKRTTSEQRERLSLSARNIIRRGKIPYQYQLMQKADLARRLSINMDEFVAYMGDLGIRVNVRGKSISYFHESRTKATRGRTLGTNYTPGGLNEQFSANKRDFKNRPDLRKSLEEAYKSNVDERGHFMGDSSSFPFLPGGHQKFRPEAYQTQNKDRSDRQYANGSISRSDSLYSFLSHHITASNCQDIRAYCEKNSIKLIQNHDGSYRLKGREHILIKGSKWENTKAKNGKKIGTNGTLLEFVANHKNCSYLEAISIITGNQNLMLLEKHLGKIERPYKEFHIPKNQQKDKRESMTLLQSLTKQLGYKSDLSRFLYNMKQVQVGVDNSVRFLMGDTARGAMKYTQNKSGGWSKSTLGSVTEAVIKQVGSSKKLKIFKDPLVFMQETRGKGKSAFSKSENLLVLGDGEIGALDFLLAENPKIRNVELFGFDQRSFSTERQKELKSRGISFTFLESGAKAKKRDRGFSR